MSHSLTSRETPEARNAQRGPEATGLCVEEAGAHKRGGISAVAGVVASGPKISERGPK